MAIVGAGASLSCGIIGLEASIKPHGQKRGSPILCLDTRSNLVVLELGNALRLKRTKTEAY
jgi:hypothetical protein